MAKYNIKTSSEITSAQIQTLLKAWGVSEWFNLTDKEFVKKFKDSEFHLLMQEENILAVARINKAFLMKFDNKEKTIGELVGLVSVQRGKGYGKEFLIQLVRNVRKRDWEVIGFCMAHNRGFYAKCDVEVLEDKGGVFVGIDESGKTEVNEDDDVININLSQETKQWIYSATTENPIICPMGSSPAANACAI